MKYEEKFLSAVDTIDRGQVKLIIRNIEELSLSKEINFNHCEITETMEKINMQTVLLWVIKTDQMTSYQKPSVQKDRNRLAAQIIIKALAKTGLEEKTDQ